MCLDDIIVFLQSVGEHVEDLREVCMALRGAGVFFKAKNCHFFQQDARYLGHIVRRGELKVRDKDDRDLKEASTSRCKKDLNRFLRMYNVYRRLVKLYA